MKKIVLISDNHSYIEPKLEPYFQEADEIWHAGDIGSFNTISWLESFNKKLRIVWGNIDGIEVRNHTDEDLIFEVEDIKVLMTHIGGYPGKYIPNAKKMIEEVKPDLFICGHSHILKMVQDTKYNLWVFNPGAFGNIGYHYVKTALKFDIDQRNITHVEIINLGPR